VDAIECKWDPKEFDPTGLKAFRSYYSGGTNYVICPLNVPPYKKRLSGFEVVVCNPGGWLEHMRSRREKMRGPRG
jgi:hypothetical protein